MIKRYDQYDSGKYAEACVAEWLEARSAARADFAYHRYPDSRSARNPIAAQPADFLASQRLTHHKVMHIEVKEVAEKTRLPRSRIRQYGKLKLFDWAGFDTLVIIYVTSTKEWVMLEGRDLFTDYDVEPPASFNLRNLRVYTSAADILGRIWA